MVFGPVTEERKLALRLLNASRFHPLLMAELAQLADGPALRPQLLQVLDTLEKGADFEHLPDLFAVVKNDSKELAYLADALTTSIDQLIASVGDAARCLLWMIALANEAVTQTLLAGVWRGETIEQEQLRETKQLLNNLAQQPPELQAELQALPQDVLAEIAALPELNNNVADCTALLRQLLALGLASQERMSANDDNPEYVCHELVRERIKCWVMQHSEELAGITENDIRLAYAQRLASFFYLEQLEAQESALQAGRAAIVYFVQAQAWESLSEFASNIVTAATDQDLLRELIPHLQNAAEAAPPGEPRWSCLAHLADAIRNAGEPETSLPFYQQALSQIRAAISGGENSQQTWLDLAGVSFNAADAFRQIGQLDTAHAHFLENAHAEQQAGSPPEAIMASELEAFNIEIMQGNAQSVLPEVLQRLTQLEGWWQNALMANASPLWQDTLDAHRTEALARTYISGLDIAAMADLELENWETALARLETLINVKQKLNRTPEDIAETQINHASTLIELKRFGQARTNLEACLDQFENNPNKKAMILSTLADLHDKQNDVEQAILLERRALAIFEQLPNPADRAISHLNLGNYLGRGKQSQLAESGLHHLASLIYCHISEIGQILDTALYNYGIRFRRTQGNELKAIVPSVHELLESPKFAQLAQWLAHQSVDIDGLQEDANGLLEYARKQAFSGKGYMPFSSQGQECQQTST